MSWPAVRLCTGASMPLLGLGTWKLWSTRHHPDDVLPACQRSLTDLGLDYLDLYLMHFPAARARGDNFFPSDGKGKASMMDIHFMETWKAMENLVDAGLVKAIGVSNFNISQMEEVLTNGRIKPAVNQVESHPYLGCHRLLERCTAKDVVMTAYCPLARPGSQEAKDFGVDSLLQDPVIVEISQKHGKTTAQVCIKWQMQRNVVVIPKSVTPARIQENSQLFDFELSEDEMSAINNLDRNARLVPFLACKGHPLYPFNGEF